MNTATQKRQLPPLILHPFADASGPGRLVESSRASLMLQGLLPSGERSAEELDRVLLQGRYSEIVMLYYVGKDLLRWIDQCQEFVSRQPDLKASGINYQSFAALLVDHAPASAEAKLRRWGVSDYRAIFRRALALNALWATAPEREHLADEFLRNYYYYADQFFVCRQSRAAFTAVDDLGFEFEIFASSEYSRMLEREWTEN